MLSLSGLEEWKAPRREKGEKTHITLGQEGFGGEGSFMHLRVAYWHTPYTAYSHPPSPADGGGTRAGPWAGRSGRDPSWAAPAASPSRRHTKRTRAQMTFTSTCGTNRMRGGGDGEGEVGVLTRWPMSRPRLPERVSDGMRRHGGNQGTWDPSLAPRPPPTSMLPLTEPTPYPKPQPHATN